MQSLWRKPYTGETKKSLIQYASTVLDWILVSGWSRPPSQGDKIQHGCLRYLFLGSNTLPVSGDWYFWEKTSENFRPPKILEDLRKFWATAQNFCSGNHPLSTEKGELLLILVRFVAEAAYFYQAAYECILFGPKTSNLNQAPNAWDHELGHEWCRWSGS